MSKNTLLFIDAMINIALGILLGIFPRGVIEMLGMPVVNTPFYASIFGGVLFGIGIALLLERSQRSTAMGGLGLAGAIAINLCGGFVLALWLLFGDIHVPIHGKIIMWSLAGILFLISTIELITGRSEHATTKSK